MIIFRLISLFTKPSLVDGWLKPHIFGILFKKREWLGKIRFLSTIIGLIKTVISFQLLLKTK